MHTLQYITCTAIQSAVQFVLISLLKKKKTSIRTVHISIQKLILSRFDLD